MVGAAHELWARHRMARGNPLDAAARAAGGEQVKPLTRYDHGLAWNRAGAEPYSSCMVPDDEGQWYAKAEADAVIRQLEAERDAARAILTSGHMQRILRFVMNHAGKGLHGTLHDSAEWIEKQIKEIDHARSPQDQSRGR